MPEALKDREVIGLADGFSRDPLAPIPPAVRAKRRRFVRLLSFVAVFGGGALSAIPSSTTTWHESITIKGTERVHKMSFRREAGLPFRTVTLTLGPGRSIQRVSLHSSGVIGNVLTAALAMIAISFLRRRRGY